MKLTTFFISLTLVLVVGVIGWANLWELSDPASGQRDGIQGAFQHMGEKLRLAITTDPKTRAELESFFTSRGRP